MEPLLSITYGGKFSWRSPISQEKEFSKKSSSKEMKFSRRTNRTPGIRVLLEGFISEIMIF